MKPNKRIIRIAIGIAAGIILIATIIGVFKWQEIQKVLNVSGQEKEVRIKSNDREYNTSFKDAEALEAKEGNVCVIYSNRGDSKYGLIEAYNQICPNSYLMCSQMSYLETEYSSKEDFRISYDYTLFQVDIYDVNTQKYIKTIDIQEILKDYPGYGPRDMAEGCWMDGKEQILLKIYPIDSRDYYSDVRFLVIDPDTEEVQMTADKDKFENISEETKPVIDDLTKWIEEYRLTHDEPEKDTDYVVKYEFKANPFNNWPGTIIMEITTKLLPEENEKLYTMFPKLKEYQGKDGYTTMLILTKEEAADIFLN